MSITGLTVSIGGRQAKVVDVVQSPLLINGFGWDPRHLLGTIVMLDKSVVLSVDSRVEDHYFELRCSDCRLDGQLVYPMGSTAFNNRFMLRYAIGRLGV